MEEKPVPMAAVFWLLIICFVYVSDNGIECSETLTPYQVFKNGQTLVSVNQRFELGFFNVSSKKDHNHRMWYLGIWYRKIKPLTVVWVGNRMKSLRGSRIRLVLNSVGDLLLRDDARTVVWVCKVAQPASRPELVLLDSGNLVIKDGDNLLDGEFVWQSFEFPTDTLLPGMKLGWDLKAGLQYVMTSWRSYEDPSNGGFVFSLKSAQSPQLLLEKNDVAVSRWGPWDGHRFSGTDAITDNPVFKSVYHFSSDEVYFTFEMLDDSILLRLVVNPIGTIQFLKWKNNAQAWVPLVTVNKDICDRYGSCGPYGICYAEDPGCRCLKGFIAKSPNDWCGMDCGDGCRRRYALNCSNGDGFVKYERQKLPDNFTVWRNLSPQECEDNCLKECFCMAYTNINIYGNGSECVVWLGNLLDIRYSIHGGEEIYVRMAHGELESIAYAKRKKEVTMIAIILISAILGMTVWCVVSWYIFNFKVAKRQAQLENMIYIEPAGGGEDDRDVTLFNISAISAATNNFSPDNQIGQGGFGPVYQGQFSDGQNIAVKRLSQNSYQGIQEFKNEVTLIAQLQHRNLVKLLGCCIQGEERMLVYEYMPNKSVDQFIFDEARKILLPWEKRFGILKGVAKGLNYLHYESIVRIIHRDLKASNVLLDNEMNPKISDFGLARIFENEREETTRRVIGTHGYMSPEYVMDGHYSMKSDVYSFGVLAIEIISGQRNWGFHHPNHEHNLLGHAWALWNEGRALELMDPVLEEMSNETKISRCIQIGLLCVQHRAEGRPTMSEVVSMLQDEHGILAEPGEPGFFRVRSFRWTVPASWDLNDSVNGLTVTTLTGRL